MYHSLDTQRGICRMRTDAHEFLRLKTKTSFRNFIKQITYNPYGEDDEKISPLIYTIYKKEEREKKDTNFKRI